MPILHAVTGARQFSKLLKGELGHVARPRKAGAIQAFVCLLCGFLGMAEAYAVQKISLPMSADMTRAEIYVKPSLGKARGTLILCPGRNGDGEKLIENAKWVQFARKENLNLVGVSFASNDDPQDRGYFDVASGSGQVLLEGLKQALGSDQVPLLVYGFSRGGQFTYSFSSWKHNLVLAWCAYSATRWEEPQPSSSAPQGIIACGENDEPNYSFSTLQFLKGRSLSLPWTWVSLKDQGHAWSNGLDEFVRTYFDAVLARPQSPGLWLDVDTKAPVSPADIAAHPTLAVWLPNEATAEAWKQIHQP